MNKILLSLITIVLINTTLMADRGETLEATYCNTEKLTVEEVASMKLGAARWGVGINGDVSVYNTPTIVSK